jgi:hypothetical protein
VHGISFSIITQSIHDEKNRFRGIPRHYLRTAKDRINPEKVQGISLHLIPLTWSGYFRGLRNFLKPLFHHGENCSGPVSLMIVVRIEYQDAGNLKCSDEEQQSLIFMDRERINSCQISVRDEEFPCMSDSLRLYTREKRVYRGCTGFPCRASRIPLCFTHPAII